MPLPAKGMTKFKSDTLFPKNAFRNLFQCGIAHMLLSAIL
jgi:hypothetical protein